METVKKISARQSQIANLFLKELDIHIRHIADGHVDKMFEIKEFADILHIHPRHLTNTVTAVTGNHPCFHFEERILIAAKQMLAENKMNIASIAALLTYDPSNFTKFFKRYTKQTPKQFREKAVRKKPEDLAL